jgi:hypothetical protein
MLTPSLSSPARGGGSGRELDGTLAGELPTSGLPKFCGIETKSVFSATYYCSFTVSSESWPCKPG